MIYLKQAWNLIKQEKLFSFIYIMGTGLSIAAVMLLAIVFYIKIGNNYPETNRDRMLIVKSAESLYPETDGGGGFMFRHGSWGGVSYQVLEQCFYSLENAETVTGVYSSWDKDNLTVEGLHQPLQVKVKYIDRRFWTVFPFKFINGHSFSEEDMQSDVRTAVISETISNVLFGAKEAEGKYMTLNNESFRVAGVVKDAPSVMENSYADIWVPYTIHPKYKDSFSEDGAIGGMRVYMLAPSIYKIGEVKKEILQNIQRFDSQSEEMEFTLIGGPDRQWQSIFRYSSNNPIDFKKVAWQYGLVLFALFLIPAVSLSGMTDSRMERRMAEIGVRRAFGAPPRSLMAQVFTENFLFTLLGGLVGLLLSYLLFYATQDWIMEADQWHTSLPEYLKGNNNRFSLSMFINPGVFFITLGICFILNFLSAFIPAWRASHREIVYSIHHTNQ